VVIYMQCNVQFQEEPLYQRDVSSTAKLFSFNRSVYMTERVWKDCVELVGLNGKTVDELAVLQRLRHVLFMASSALHGRVADLECEFSIHRVPNDAVSFRPEQTMLKLIASTGELNQPQITIKHLSE
jgi:hypothetical protein